MLMSNSSSSSMTSSTVSSESAPKSFTNEVSGVIFSLSTPSCSATISMTRSATDATFAVLQKGNCGWKGFSLPVQRGVSNLSVPGQARTQQDRGNPQIGSRRGKMTNDQISMTNSDAVIGHSCLVIGH